MLEDPLGVFTDPRKRSHLPREDVAYADEDEVKEEKSDRPDSPRTHSPVAQDRDDPLKRKRRYKEADRLAFVILEFLVPLEFGKTREEEDEIGERRNKCLFISEFFAGVFDGKFFHGFYTVRQTRASCNGLLFFCVTPYDSGIMTKHLLLPLLLGAIAFLGGLSSLAFAQSAEGNSPPTVDPIHANLFPPTTTYAVEATDPDGDPLQYHWERDIACGVFIGSGPSASWSHPEGVAPLGCPHEDGTSHDGVVSVHVTDGTHYVLCSYTGSESGDGAQCITNAPEYSPGVMDRWMGYIYEICYWLWLPLLIGMLWLGRWLYQNGLFVGRKEEDTDPCAELRRKEAEARARYNAAREGFDEIDRLKRDADAKDRAAKDAEAKAERARNAAGGKWSAQGSTDWEGEHTEISREGWQNKEAGAKADAATAEARAAREAAGKANARSRFSKTKKPA